MRRSLVRVCVILLAGVLINAAATVALAAFVNIIGLPDTMEHAAGRSNGVGLSIGIDRRFGSARVSVTETPQPIGFTPMEDPAEKLPRWLDVSIYASPEALPRDLSRRIRDFQARGWPWLCGWCQERGSVIFMRPRESQRQGLEGGYELPLPPSQGFIDGWSAPRILPLRPIWGGLVLNSVLYAGLAGVIVIAFGRWRRLRRYRRGRCPRCRRELQHDYSRTCPHCGFVHPKAKEMGSKGSVHRSVTAVFEEKRRAGKGARASLPALVIALLLSGFALTAVSTVIIAMTVDPYGEGMWGPSRIIHGVEIQTWRMDGFGTSFLRLEERTEPRFEQDSAVDPLERIPNWLRLDFLLSAEKDSIKERDRRFEARGWPLRCAWCETVRIIQPVNQTPRRTELHGGRKLPLPQWQAPQSNFPHPRVLPLRPIWAGLALNTLFYALLLVIVLLIIRRGLNLRRYRRGRCPRCGYDRRFVYASPCPECGG